VRRLTTALEYFELAKPFAISTGRIEGLTVLHVEIQDGEFVGRGECVPSAAKMVSRQEGQQLAEAARSEIQKVQPAVEAGATNAELMRLLPSCPARNAVDCALWDLTAKLAKRPVAELLGVTLPESLLTAYTISLNDPDTMEAEARANRQRALLKLKLGGPDDEQIVTAVRRAAPNADIIVDVNGGWTIERLTQISSTLQALGVRLVEQPLPVGADAVLAERNLPVALAADESCQDRTDLVTASQRYDYINIKLDKTGGLTEALALAREARALGLGVMVGCMAGTSLSMAPAVIVGSLADVVDLDGPLLLKSDRPGGMSYRGDRIFCVNSELWG
jgi:L-alanine-DL-glutamate epimerase-like enolase superfamily enzyme